ncbi:MAG: FAD-dependent oxidoreductase [Nanoarchaeota archaeon]
MKKVQVLIIGGGVSGASVAFHLGKININCLLIEAGNIGRGCEDKLSGTAVPKILRHSKMILTGFPSNIKNFIEKHGIKNATNYLEMSVKGSELQKTIAKKINPFVIREYGSLIVADKSRSKKLLEEFKLYKKLGMDNIIYKSKEDIVSLYGKDCNFINGIFFPKDALIDSESYAKEIISYSKIPFLENTKLLKLKENKNNILAFLSNNETIIADFVVLATNGLFIPNEIKGLIKPCWSYIVCSENKGINTSNAISFTNSYHDWTRQDNILRLSGEDGHPANRKPNMNYIKKLVDWSDKEFGKNNILTNHFGVYAETIDELPIADIISKNKRICYIGGCNAQGQATLSYAASLISGILGYEKMNSQQRKIARLLSIKRFIKK